MAADPSYQETGESRRQINDEETLECEIDLYVEELAAGSVAEAGVSYSLS